MYILVSCMIVDGIYQRCVAMMSHVMEAYITMWTHTMQAGLPKYDTNKIKINRSVFM